jgi:hypothetical protein
MDRRCRRPSRGPGPVHPRAGPRPRAGYRSPGWPGPRLRAARRSRHRRRAARRSRAVADVMQSRRAPVEAYSAKSNLCSMMLPWRVRTATGSWRRGSRVSPGGTRAGADRGRGGGRARRPGRGRRRPGRLAGSASRPGHRLSRAGRRRSGLPADRPAVHQGRRRHGADLAVDRRRAPAHGRGAKIPFPRRAGRVTGETGA